MTQPQAPTLPDAFAMVVRFTLKEGHEQAFDDLMATTVAEIRHSEPRTLAYVVHHVEGEPLIRIFYELYADQAAFQHHETAPHILHFAAERPKHLEKVEVDRLSVFTHAGVDYAAQA
jgi:quinol monooxygenase YgiN